MGSLTVRTTKDPFSILAGTTGVGGGISGVLCCGLGESVLRIVGVSLVGLGFGATRVMGANCGEGVDLGRPLVCGLCGGFSFLALAS